MRVTSVDPWRETLATMMEEDGIEGSIILRSTLGGVDADAITDDNTRAEVVTVATPEMTATTSTGPLSSISRVGAGNCCRCLILRRFSNAKTASDIE